MNTNSPLIIVISAPSGTGKTTIVKELINRNNNMVASVSCTTRKQRGNEIDGKDYNFISADMFSSMVKNKSFLEYAKVFDCFYGTPKNGVEDNLRKGLNVILEIDWQGAMQIKKERLDCIMLFLIPPSKNALLDRLKKRGTDSTSEIQLRYNAALNDISHYGVFDNVFVNKEINTTVDEITAFVKNAPHENKKLSDEAKLIIKSFHSLG